MNKNTKEDYSSNSDSSDDDYCPENVKEDLSEEESDDPCDDNCEETSIGHKRSKKTSSKGAKKKRTQNDIINEENKNEIAVDTTDLKEKTIEEDQKKKADSLWADFLSDTGSKPKAKKTNETRTEKSPKTEKVKQKKEVVKVTKIFDFAGEQVKVEKEVPIDSAEARLFESGTNITSNSSSDSKVSSTDQKPGLKILPKKSGMQSILGQINKKNTISTLEKSKLDWDGYKKNQGIEEEIQNHNKGKDGYLEKQDFLQRTDLRQFEIEKQLRTTRRSNR